MRAKIKKIMKSQRRSPIKKVAQANKGGRAPIKKRLHKRKTGKNDENRHFYETDEQTDTDALTISEKESDRETPTQTQKDR